MMGQTRINRRRDVVKVAVVVLAFIAAFIALRYGVYLWLEGRM